MKLQHTTNGTTSDYYTADVVTANDYYPFGMVIPGRKYSAGTGYRYGFNGKENDSEVKGECNQQDYGFRIYDPRIGRFLSEDPVTQEYPELTPYQFASNTPIQAIDLDGLEAAGVGGGVSMRQLQSTTAADQTGKGMVAMGKGYVSSARNTVEGTFNAVTHPKQIVKSVVKTVSNPVKTWNGMKTGFKQWGSNLMSTDPDVAGSALGAGFWFGTEIVIPVPPIMKGVKKLGIKIPYLSGKFIIGQKTLSKVTAHLEQFGVKAENTIMLDRMEKIANKEMKATEIDINFAKHELRESELMKKGRTYNEAHEAVLKEQNMYHRDYEKKLYTEEAIKAGNEQMAKEVKDGIK